MKVRLVLLVLLFAQFASGCAPRATVTPGPTSTPAGQLWKFRDLSDPGAPKLIEKHGDTFRLKPDWKVASIEFLYGWWGLGKPGNEHQTIALSGSEYKKGTATVSRADVKALLANLDRLYPTQLLLAGQSWTDDYPQWLVELTGESGEHILLNSSSTGNPGNGPWNVLYNGRLYAQYDGSLAGPLGKLFGGRLAEPDSEPFGDMRSGKVSFSSGGLPPQLVYGFWGLLPISSGFSYKADIAKREIAGRIEGQSRIGSMEIGDIDELSGVKLRPEGSAEVPCTIETLPEGDPWTATTAWSFSCPVSPGAEGEPYSYPILVEFGRQNNDTSQVAGDLYGIWSSAQEQLLMPPPVEWDEALAKNEAAADLLTDHTLSYLLYSAEVDAKEPMSGTRQGEAILLGEMDVEGAKVRYTVGTPFSLQQGKFSYWTLDRRAVDDLVRQVGGLALTKRVRVADPEVTINLWYAGSKLPDQRFDLLGGGGQRYEVKVNPCGQVEGGIFPSSEHPLQGFGYNSGPSMYMVDFILKNGKPIVAELDLFPLEKERSRGPAGKALVPEELDTGQSRPFARIWMQTHPDFMQEGLVPGSTELTLWKPEDATAEENALYERLSRALPG
ncbi:MAG: hypothetical protein M3328_02530, partial [Chloroflexota bacterium]|nr:hypothetical protein [Chloroflexota bacterium]